MDPTNMSSTDSGVETGSDSNESTTMSVESPARLSSDQDVEVKENESVDPPAGLSFLNVQPLPQQYGYNISYHPFSGKMRPRMNQQKHSARWRHMSGVVCPQVRDMIGERKLRIASNWNNFEIAQKLLEAGVNPCAADERKRTALHFSACKGYTNIVRLLLEYGADPNQKDIVGNTALHLAACTNHTEVVTLLLKAGTDVNSLDNSGRTPLHLAQSKLKLLHMDASKSSENLKQEVMQVIEMMQIYLQRSGKAAESDMLNAFSTRLQLHQTRQEVDNDVQDLLSSLAHLSLHKT